MPPAGSRPAKGPAAPEPTQPAKRALSKRAPELTVPSIPITCVEHPCIVRNIPKAIQSLGGGLRLEKFLEETAQTRALGLRLRPNDTVSRPILSQSIKTQDVVLRVTVPRRTGRRRPRGTTGEFVTYDRSSDDHRTKSGKILFRTLQDVPSKAAVQPVGVVWESYRFRNLPDFQYDSSTDSLMQKVRDTLLTYDYSKLRQFDINTQIGFPDDQDVGPPAAFCHLNSQFNYGYEQNPAIRTLDDGSGGHVTVNLQAMRGHITHVVTLDSPTVPHESPIPLAPRESLHPDLQAAIRELEAILAVRPIISRRVSRNLADKATVYCQRFAWSYVGYVFKSGPWKDCLIRFGLDPRIDPGCRQYQVLSFQFADPDEAEEVEGDEDQIQESTPQDPASTNTVQPTQSQPADEQQQEQQQPQPQTRPKLKLVSKLASPTSHIFDGKSAHLDGKTWQLCDVTDPTIRALLSTENIASTPDIQGNNGWYTNGTLIVVRTLMRDMIQLLMSGTVPDQETYAPFLTWPAAIDDESAPQLRLPNGSTEKQVALAFEIRVKISSIVSDKEKQQQHHHHHHYLRTNRPGGEPAPGRDDQMDVD